MHLNLQSVAESKRESPPYSSVISYPGRQGSRQVVGKGRRPEFPSFKPVTFGNSRILETAILDQLGIQSTVTSMVYLFEKNAVHRFRHSVSPFSKVDLIRPVSPSPGFPVAHAVKTTDSMVSIFFMFCC